MNLSITQQTIDLWKKYDEKIPETLERLKNKETISSIAKDFGFFKDGFVDYLAQKGSYQKRAWALKPHLDMALLKKAYRMYTQEDMTITKIAEVLNVNRKTLSKDLKKAFDLQVRQDGKKRLNDNFFDEINNPENAYWLGYFYADGCNSENRNDIEFTQQAADKERVYALKAALGSSHKVMVKNVYLEDTGKTYEEYRLTFKSKKMSHDLEKWGCVPNKTYEAAFPGFIDDKLMPHFIRGYFDGDGCITNINRRGTVRFTCASKKYVDGLHNFFSEIGITSTVRKVDNKENWEIYFSSNEKLNRFYKYIYDDTDESIRMKRKYDKYTTYLQNNHCRPETKAV